MRNIIIGRLMTCCFLFFALVALPMPLLAAEEAKFGAIDIQKVLNESETGKRAKSELETLIKTKQSVIDEKGKAIEKLKSDIEKQSSVLSGEAKKNKEDELERHLREYQRLVQDSQGEIKKKEGELTDGILREIRELIEKMGEQEGYTLIIEKGMVLYSNKGIDITDDVLKKYDASKAKTKK